MTPNDTESLLDSPSTKSHCNSVQSCPSPALHWSYSLRWQDKQTNGPDYFTLVMLVERVGRGKASGDFLQHSLPLPLFLHLYYPFIKVVVNEVACHHNKPIYLTINHSNLGLIRFIDLINHYLNWMLNAEKEKETRRQSSNNFQNTA